MPSKNRVRKPRAPNAEPNTKLCACHEPHNSHHFGGQDNETLTCDNKGCGATWYEQQQDATECQHTRRTYKGCNS